jgi:hypothetical protein
MANKRPTKNRNENIHKRDFKAAEAGKSQISGTEIIEREANSVLSKFAKPLTKPRKVEPTKPKMLNGEVPLPASTNPLLDGISGIPTGLTIYHVANQALVPHVRSVVGSLASEKSSVLGIPMPQNLQAVHSLVSGSPRQIEQSKLFAAASSHAAGGVICVKVCHAQKRLEWASNEGLQVLSRYIEEAKDCVLIIEQVIVGPITPEISHVLIRIGNAAKEAGAWVMFLIVCTKEQQNSQLSGVCDEFVEVALCEPEVGAYTAFSFDCIGISELNSLGIGKTMCSVMRSDGGFQYRYDPFVSEKLDTRIMWTMRAQGIKLDEIGIPFKLTKSTVLRRLQDLPKPRQLDLPKDWLSDNLEMFSAPTHCTKSNAKGDRDGDDTES